jgi:hypothetical protein
MIHHDYYSIVCWNLQSALYYSFNYYFHFGFGYIPMGHIFIYICHPTSLLLFIFRLLKQTLIRDNQHIVFYLPSMKHDQYQS